MRSRTEDRVCRSQAAGKTTITNLIYRFMTLGRKNSFEMLHVNKIKKDDLRRSLESYCRTRTSLPGVMENIRYGKLDATA